MGKDANPTRGKFLGSRDGLGSLVPHQLAHRLQAKSGAYSQNST